MVLIVETDPQQLAMLRILHAACSTAVDTFQAPDNAVDHQLVADLEAMVERTRGELERLASQGHVEPR